jgi:5-aminolevulinate synthase
MDLQPRRTLGTLGKLMPGCAIFSDALNHNSMIEGIRRSGAERFIFRHNDAAHLDELLNSIAPDRPRSWRSRASTAWTAILLPIAAICDVAEKHGAITYLDEVHAVGLYGARACMAEQWLPIVSRSSRGLSPRLGVMGGYVAGPALVMDGSAASPTVSSSPRRSARTSQRARWRRCGISRRTRSNEPASRTMSRG